jgi:hypothetical protein
MVLAFGLEMAEEHLQPQINLVASVKGEPEDEQRLNNEQQQPIEPESRGQAPGADEERQRHELVVQEELEKSARAALATNGAHPETNGSVGARPDNAGERRDQSGESGKNDFVDALAPGPSDGPDPVETPAPAETEEEGEIGENDETRVLHQR